MTAHAIHADRARLKARALPRLSRFAQEHLLVLPAGAVAALVWANGWPEPYYRFVYGAEFWVNDVAMAFFFAIITKEVVESTVPGGVLHTWRRALVPMAAALGAVAVSLLCYAGLVRLFGESMLAAGWPAVIGTDLAVSYAMARGIFGRHPAVPFVLLLGLGANTLGFLAIAAAHPLPGAQPGVGLLLVASAVAVAAGLRTASTRSFWPYILLAGPVAWAGLYMGGVHPAFALILVVPFIPHATRDPGFFVDAPPAARDALNRFDRAFTLPAQAALLLFGLVNAGVLLRGLEPGTWALPLAAVVGKPAGVLLGVSIAVAAGLRLPSRVDWRALIVIGLLASIGFTVGLFFATAALPPGQLLAETKTGALVSIAAAALAVGAARALRVGRFAGSPGGE